MEENVNKHTGSTFDEFLEDEDIILDERLESLSKTEIEELEKSGKCVRCGKPNMNGTKGGRCKACMNKLTAKRHTPGSKERSWKHADQALRREQGRSGTTTGGHKSGHGKRQEIQRKMRAAEKKTGSKLSLDRHNNERGYEGKNTRAVPEKLNRGRHKVDPKKLAAWRKRIKKSGLELDDFKALMTAKAYENGQEDLAKTLELFDDNFLEQLFKDLESDSAE